MTTFFYEGQTLNLPSAAEFLNLSQPVFTVVKVMGGGMGVCAKIQASDGSFYALKVIYLDLLDDKNAFARYINEVKTWMTLSACDGIAEAICLEQVNEVPCVISKWMDGGDLSAYISSREKAFFFRTMERLILSLKWAYDKHGYIHRDIKPANILLDKEKNAYVADWGLAKDLSKHISVDVNGKKIDVSNPELTAAGGFLGTISYASPEQILGKKDIDFRSDIYSLGCLMYEWETGQRPFSGKTCEEIAYSQLYTKPKKIGGFFVTTNFGVEKIILRCLEKSPLDRYQSYDELLTEIRKVGKKSCNIEPLSLKERYNAVKIGYDEFCTKLKNKEFKAVYGSKGASLVSEEDIQPYLWEANKLLSLSEWQKAVDILERLYEPNLFRKFPDMGLHQFVAINISLAYCRLQRYDQALTAIHSIDNAKNLCADYYVNLSCVLVELKNHNETKKVCLDGLKFYPQDKDLQANLTLAYLGLNELNSAAQSAFVRLKMQRDLSALMGAAMVSTSLAELEKNKDFPSAIKYYVNALSLYKEAESLNPTQVNIKRNIANILFKLKKYADSSAKIMEVNKLINGSTAIDSWYIARNLQWSCPPQDCKTFCEKWLKVFPKDERLNTLYAQLLFEDYCLGQYTKDGFPIVTQQCIDVVNKVNQGGTERVDMKEAILAARILFWIANGEEETENQAIEILKNLKAQHPNSWACDFYLASIYATKGNLAEAVRFIEFAIIKAPWREGCFSLASQIYSACGRMQESQSCKEKANALKDQKKEMYKNALN